MTIYVPIHKERETDGVVVYRYGVADDSFGLLEIDKANGAARLIEGASGDDGQRSYALAARKLLTHFEAGELPDETCWAS